MTASAQKAGRLSRAEWTALKAEIKARVQLSEVVARHGVKLKRAGREFVGLSPFNSERTPSFTVNDDKRFFHCFSSGRHGDIFTWLMFSQNMSFGQAVEEGRRLAGLADGPVSQKQIEARRRADDQRSQSEAGRKARMLEYAHGLWTGADKADGGLVEEYFRSRNIDLVALGGVPECIRFHKRVKNKSGEVFPAMLTKITGRAGGFAGAHVTFLRGDGRGKINTRRMGPKGRRLSKQIFGNYFGGAARLIGPPNPGGGNILSIGEGVESVLSAYQLYLECGNGGGMWWAALSLGNLTGAQLSDKWGRPQFNLSPRRLAAETMVRKCGVPAPDLNRPGFLPPADWLEPGGVSVRILCEDDLKDDHRRGISGTERAVRAYTMAAAKFKRFGAAKVRNVWPPKGQDFNDILLARPDANSRIGLPKKLSRKEIT